jgi:UDP-N-acetylmuramoyl-L-alanyl-D-glutamate--2,6-diaminopimelate ligase
MNLQLLTKAIQPVSVTGGLDRDITAICYDSRRVIEGALFVALPGEKADGTEFIDAAIDRGAAAIVSEKPGLTTRATSLQVGNARHALADLSAAFFRHPSQRLKVAGVTGTNGKTTTTFLLKHILDSEFLRCGLIGTVRYVVGDRELPAARTTPESADVHELLWQMRSAGCKSCAMEVSSHALALDRVRGVEFDAGVFTNLSQDHLDYHRTMDAYFEAKAGLFSGIREQKKKTGRAVVNIDDRHGAMLVERFGHGKMEMITYGMGRSAQFRASDVHMDFGGTTYQLEATGKSYLVRMPLIGGFNVYNSLAAIAGAHALGVNVRHAVQALAAAPAVPGRLQGIPAQKPFRVFVDYAHSDDALTNVLKTLRELNPARLIAVFGCGGNRDRAKRPKMAAAVDAIADHAIVTSDNPRKEDPLAIIDDIKPGFRRLTPEIVPDRREAIFRAIAMAQPRDIILLAGKGHETYQEFADHTLPFDDAAIAAGALGSRTEIEAPSLRPRNPREHSEERPLDAEERRRRREDRDR